jgi:thioredoxin reductase
MNDGAAQRGPVLNDEQFRRLAAYGEVEHAEAGRDLYVSGDDSYDFFLLLTATVDIVRDATAIEPERLIFHGGADLEAGMSSYLTDRVRAHSRIQIHAGSTVRELAGDDTLTSIVVERPGERPERLACRALFCFIGADPVSGWLSGVAKAGNGFVLTDGPLPTGSSGSRLPFQTSAPRVFAVGDLRSGSTKRVATAVGDGASAVSSVHVALTGD